VWQEARLLVKGVYRASRKEPLKSDRGLVDQMTRAAVSVTSNIAEGFERGSRAQNVEFCFYAKGSLGELRSQVIVARDAELIDSTTHQWLHGKCEDVSRQLAGYVKHQLETVRTIPGMKFTRESDRTRRSWEEIAAELGLVRQPDGRFKQAPEGAVAH
jgi:four helix bundle protein